MGYRLGVDLGTTFTAAALDDGSGPAMLGLGNRSLQVPSVVFLQTDGTFVYGEAAERAAATAPERSVREFKRRIGDTVPILVAGQPFSPQALTGRLLGWVVGRASQRQGEGPEQVVLTYPANWGGYKRELLRQVVSLADLSDAVTCTEPEAAATQYASRARLSVGDKLAVYDLGGGTFDVCVLEQQAGGGFKILGSPDGVEHLGGIDFDEAVFAHVWAMLGDRVASLDPEDPAVVVGVSRLRRDCVEAKEALSESVEAVIPVTLPGLSTTVRLTRRELEALIGVPLRDTVDATHRALRSAGVAAGELSAVVLVGGSSRIPLVSQLLRSELGVPTAMDTHPKHDIALGAVRYRPLSVGASAPAAARTVRQWPTRGEGEAAAPPAVPPRASTPPRRRQAEPSESPVPTQPPQPPAGQPPGRARQDSPKEQPSRSRRPLLIAAAAITVLVTAAGAGIALTFGDDPNPPQTQDDPTASPPTTTEPSRQGVLPLGPDSILVPMHVDDELGLDLKVISVASDSFGLVVDTLVSDPGDQTSPSLSPDGTVVQYRSREGVGEESTDEWAPYVVGADGEQQEMFATEPVDLWCPLRELWNPSDPDRVTMLCHQDADGDGERDPGRGLYTAPVDEAGRVDGASFELVLSPSSRTSESETGSPNSTLGGISFHPDGGSFVVNYEKGDIPGLHIRRGSEPPDRITSGNEDGSVWSPAGDRIAFIREGDGTADLYLVAPDGSGFRCSGEREVDEITRTPLCNLTAWTDEIASSPTWSSDGSTIAVRIGDPVGESSLELVAVDSPDDHFQLLGVQRLGPPAWSPR